MTLAAQPSLFDKSIQQQFEEFHAANPGVYRRLVALARRAQARGHRRIGIELLFAVLRWEHLMQTTDANSGYKLNDHYTSRYARLIMDREADLDGFFETRRLKSI